MFTFSTYWVQAGMIDSWVLQWTWLLLSAIVLVVAVCVVVSCSVCYWYIYAGAAAACCWWSGWCCRVIHSRWMSVTHVDSLPTLAGQSVHCFKYCPVSYCDWIWDYDICIEACNSSNNSDNGSLVRESALFWWWQIGYVFVPPSLNILTQLIHFALVLQQVAIPLVFELSVF